MLILLFGKNGQVGWELQKSLSSLGTVLAVGREDLDLVNADGEVRRYVREHRPNIIINAAAYTDVNRAETEPVLAMRLNGTIPGILAEEAKHSNSLLIHYSTDYVFDGTKNIPYLEEDSPSPLNIYGNTKLAGEHAIQGVGGAYLILRTSWVYGMRGRNFLLTILRLARERDELRVVDDQVGAPTWCRSIANTTVSLLSQTLSEKDWFEKTKNDSGIYHYAASGQTTWYEFAKAILEFNGKNNPQPLPRLIPIASSEFPSPASRPLYSVLSQSKISNQFGLAPLDWKEQLAMAFTG